MTGPVLFGIVNMTEDSFSDGGRFLDPSAAIIEARRLAAGGAGVIDLGASASNIAAKPVSADEEIRRLEPVISALQGDGAAISVDCFLPETQRFAIRREVDFINDIHGFPNPALYPDLAAARCRLVVMHAVQGRGRAQRVAIAATDIWDRIETFFAARIVALERGGIARERLILDPGMGFFLSTQPEASLRVLAGLGRLRQSFALPILVSVSRKSFLAAVTGRQGTAERGPGTLAAELYAAANGADYIRTHDPASLRDGLTVMAALRAEEGAIR